MILTSSPKHWNRWGRVLYFLFPKTIGIIHTQGSDIGYEQGYTKGFEHGFSDGYDHSEEGWQNLEGFSYREYLEKIRNDGLNPEAAKV
jgi:hypothetical protein